jgi:hypothetical protein
MKELEWLAKAGLAILIFKMCFEPAIRHQPCALCLRSLAILACLLMALLDAPFDFGEQLLVRPASKVGRVQRLAELDVDDGWLR